MTQANDCISVLKALRSDNSDKLVFAHININSIRNKFEFLSTQVKEVVEVPSMPCDINDIYRLCVM